MRQIFFSAVFLLAAGSAMAASIDVVGSVTAKKAGSIVMETCDSCPPLSTKTFRKDYSVPEMRPGTFQQAEVRDVGGEKKIYRTENWMGGSPIIFVSKATPEQILALAPPVPVEGIDSQATAAVVNGDVKPLAADMGQAASLDLSAFDLRF